VQKANKIPHDKVQAILKNAENLYEFLIGISPKEDAAGQLAHLLGENISELQSALEREDAIEIRAFASFPALDGRAIDATGGFNFTNYPEIADSRDELNQAIRDILRYYQNE
jgi:hypothetical protein